MDSRAWTLDPQRQPAGDCVVLISVLIHVNNESDPKVCGLVGRFHLPWPIPGPVASFDLYWMLDQVEALGQRRVASKGVGRPRKDDDGV
jgi:hypothetical protein